MQQKKPLHFFIADLLNIRRYPLRILFCPKFQILFKCKI